MLDQQFQIRVMRIQDLQPVSTDVARQFRRHLMKSPPHPRTLLKHLPTTGIHGLPVVNRPTLLETLTHITSKTLRTEKNGASHPCDRNQPYPRAPQLPRSASQKNH